MTMNRRIVIVFSAAAVLLPLIAPGQTPTSAPAKPAAKAAATKAYVVPKTPWGDPDLQGMWPSVWGVPLERPKNLADRAALSDAGAIRTPGRQPRFRQAGSDPDNQRNSCDRR